jgi:hypothetical protein
MKPNKMKLIIDRKTWLRGEGNEKSALLRECDGKMCCLGVFALAIGLSAERISNVESPEMVPVAGAESVASLWKKFNPVSGFIFNGGEASVVCRDLMCTNDDQSMYDVDREEKIAKLFAKGGVEVEFIGEQE